MDIFERILKARGLDDAVKREAFLYPKYEGRHNPFLLPDMKKAVARLVMAHKEQEKITIYGDYDIDGLTATTILLDAFKSFGFKSVDAFIPNRFVEGYGLTIEAIEKIAATGTRLIITVDCGSLSTQEIERANELDVDVIVTDHHNVLRVQPPAVAVINPKRLLQDYPGEYNNLILKEESKRSGEIYPFLDLAGCGVAFKLVQALQTELDGLDDGQEKWLLDLVALGTVCDVVTLVDENRVNVFWGLKVLAKTRRPGLKALMAVARVDPVGINARSLGFQLGPRMNAAGRLETAQYALDMLMATDNMVALEKARKLNDMNISRRIEQDKIFEEAVKQAEKFIDDPVLVVSGKNWNHGIIGIVAAKLLEKFHKPTFVLERMGEESKGSARSYGDFSAADAIRAADDIITKGGGHRAAAGVTLPVKNIEKFRKRVNEFYKSQQFKDQATLLLPIADTSATFEHVDEQLIELLNTLEPFGNGNPQPILKSEDVLVVSQRRMGAEGQHVKLEVQDYSDIKIQMHAFSAPENFFVESGERISVWYQLDVNEWNGRRTIEGRLLHIQPSD